MDGKENRCSSITEYKDRNLERIREFNRAGIKAGLREIGNT